MTNGLAKQTRSRILASLAVAAGCSVTAGVANAQSTYLFTPLTGFTSPGVPDPANQTSATSINSNINSFGEVVGQLASGTAGYSTFGGPLTTLGSAATSSAQGVNSGGIAVGYNGDLGSAYNAVYFNTLSTPTVSTALPAHITAGTSTGGTGTFNTNSSLATAVNGNIATFEAIGSASYPLLGGNGPQHAFLWHQGDSTLTALDPQTTGTGLGGPTFGTSSAEGLNAAGYIVGQATNANSDVHAYIYSPSTAKMYDLGTAVHAASGDSSNAAAINTAGMIVGQSDTVDPIDPTMVDSLAFSYTGYTLPTAGQPAFTAGAFTSLGALDSSNPQSEALGLNSLGVIVGDSYVDDQNNPHAFVYENSAMYDLNSLTTLPDGWVLTSATGINDLGQITGYATYDQSSPYAYVLSPSPGVGSQVPEPGSIAVMVAGVAFGTSRRHRRLIVK